jgi:superfamily I DNA/RNA helicase
MVLCRNNAPLMKLYTELIRNGKKCKIRGKDIGLNLKKIVKSTKKDELNVDLKKDGVFVRLYDDLFSVRNKMMEKSGLSLNLVMNDSYITNKLDIIKALEVLSEGVNKSDELIKKIDEMFSDKKNVGISLSTIHKAKGLEAANVFIVCPSLMPCKSAVKDWEKEQEHNLMYVAYTRAKNKLCFLDESEFKNFTNDNSCELKYIEEKVNKILGKETKIHIDSIKTKDIISKIKKIERPKIGVLKNLSESGFTNNSKTSLDGLLNNRFKKVKRK